MAEAPPRRWPALELTHPTSLDPIADSLLTALHDLDATGLEERGPSQWLIHFVDTESRDRAEHVLGITFSSASVTIRALEIRDEHWATRTQASLKAIRIGRLTIAPPWDVPPDVPLQEVIVIEPSTGFGTGHHASTRLCLLALQDLVLTNRHVLDLGTGSGVLALAARRLGASAVTAVDTDPDALAAARANLARESDGRSIETRCADFRELRDSPGDVVVANITGAILIAAAAHLLARVVPGGDLVVGGFTPDEEASVRYAFRDSASVATRYVEDGWVALRFVKAPGGSEVAPDELQHGDRGE